MSVIERSNAYTRTRIRICELQKKWPSCGHALSSSVARAGASADQFRTPTLKRHNPKTVRKNTGDEYHGCLRIDVRRSSGLYRKIEGWSTAIVGGS